MNNEIDYDTVEKSGATHYGDNGRLCKFDQFGYMVIYNFNTCEFERFKGSDEEILSFNIKPIPPRPELKEPEYEYVKKVFNQPWEAAKAVCNGVELFVFDSDNNPYSLSQRRAFIVYDNNRQIYTRQEIKRDWRDGFVFDFDGVSKCELTENIIIDESFNKFGAARLAKAMLKAAGEGL